MTSKTPFGQILAHHVAFEGAAAIIVAALHLFFLRGASIGQVMFFLVPLVFAFVYWQKSPKPHTRQLAFAFFASIAIGAMIAPFPTFMPKLGGMARGLPPGAERLLAWYAGIYMVFAMIVIPLNAFIGNLVDHRRGMPTKISPPTCYLGLTTVLLIAPSLPWMLGKFLGFWPLL